MTQSFIAPMSSPAQLRLASLIFLLLAACAETPNPDPPSTGANSPVTEASASLSAESWQCRNDLEVRCSAEKCEAESGDGFTPMSVAAGASGTLSVCAYSGCWEGTGAVTQDERFLVLIGHDLEFSTARDPEQGKEDIVLVIDRADGVATLKAGDFAQPLLCQSLEGEGSQGPSR